MSSVTMFDSACNGSLISTEISPYRKRMRISRLSNPFRTQSLLEIAFDACREFYPAISNNPAILRLQNVQNSGGCTLFSNSN